MKCTFCSADIPKGSGKQFVKDSGQIISFCSSKCQKNMLKLGRDARKLKWTASFIKGEAPSKEASKKTAKKAVKKE